VVTHIDEPVSILLLGFHTKRRTYCAEYRIEDADKRICEIAIDYVHFCISIEGYPVNESEYLIAFLPRMILPAGLQKLADEFCYIAEWLEIAQKINCLVFRYGPPVHNTDNIMHWQKQFQRNLEETRALYIVSSRVEGRVRHIATSPVEKNMTISKNQLFECITVS
jgi:hypothetical protein